RLALGTGRAAARPSTWRTDRSRGAESGGESGGAGLLPIHLREVRGALSPRRAARPLRLRRVLRVRPEDEKPRGRDDASIRTVVPPRVNLRSPDSSAWI